MSPAKVTPPKGEVFYIARGKDIHNLAPYDRLPDLDRLYLSGRSIKGDRNGFVLTSDFQETIVFTQYRYNANIHLPGVGARWARENGRSVLVLPGGTKFEPRTIRQMENEIRALQRPSRRER